MENEARGISVKFGQPLLQRLLDKSQYRGLIRAHEQKDAGYKLHMWNGLDKDPPCITIFSAPNYCNHDNSGTVFVTGPSIQSKILTFREALHKVYHLPDPEIFEYPVEPYDALRWFMPGLREWVS